MNEEEDRIHSAGIADLAVRAADAARPAGGAQMPDGTQAVGQAGGGVFQPPQQQGAALPQTQGGVGTAMPAPTDPALAAVQGAFRSAFPGRDVPQPYGYGEVRQPGLGMSALGFGTERGGYGGGFGPALSASSGREDGGVRGMSEYARMIDRMGRDALGMATEAVEAIRRNGGVAGASAPAQPVLAVSPIRGNAKPVRRGADGRPLPASINFDTLAAAQQERSDDPWALWG